MSSPLLTSPPVALRKKNESLLLFLSVAAAIHIFFILETRFSVAPAHNTGRIVEITLVNSIPVKAPEKARYLAQENQIDAGIEESKPQSFTPKNPTEGNDLKKQRQHRKTRPENAIEHRLITQKTAPEKVLTAEKVAEKTSEEQPEMSMEELDRQIALLTTKIQKQQENSAKTRIESLNSISAHKYAATQYIKNWDSKVERVGNLNYPQIQGRTDFSGTLSLKVGINIDGSIYDMKIVESSGIPELDEAAKQIVKMSAPFAALPESLTEELDVLEIQRVWSFSDEGTLSSD